MSGCVHTGEDCPGGEWCALNEKGLANKADACVNFRKSSQSQGAVNCRSCRIRAMCVFACWRRENRERINEIIGPLIDRRRELADGTPKHTPI